MECYNAVLHFAFSFALVFRNRTLKMDLNKENFSVHLHFDTVNPTSKKSTKSILAKIQNILFTEYFKRKEFEMFITN